VGKELKVDLISRGRRDLSGTEEEALICKDHRAR
jgi:hypothetical protein